jgi:hypothetical protein
MTPPPKRPLLAIFAQGMARHALINRFRLDLLNPEAIAAGMADLDTLVGVAEKRQSLTSLLEGVTDENLHGEIDFGPPQGKEIW